MCGILFHQARTSEEEATAKVRFETIQHRGPDNSSHLVINEKFMGTHRLAIINTTPTGNQPFEMNGSTLICNGQIYNYRELALQNGIEPASLRSDVDIILHLYAGLGMEMIRVINLLDGDFAFVLFDTERQQLFVGRDIVGVRPLFWSRSLVDTRVVAVASELKALGPTDAKQEGRDIQVFTPGTLFSYDYTTEMESSCLFTEAILESQIVELLRKAVIKRIDNSDRPVAFLCSGGLDSSIILCLAHEYLKNEGKGREMQVFSMRYSGDSKYTTNSKSDDEFYCEQLVRLLDPPVKYTSLSYSLEDVKECLEKVIIQTETYDPNTVRTSIANYLLAKKLKEVTDSVVFLSGEGADELFCGYLYFNQAKSGTDINIESDRLVQNIHMFDILKADRCFAAFGMEVRVPFLDKEFIRFVRQINGFYKGFINHTEKFMLRSAFKHVFPVLTESRVIDRAKERFSDGVSFSYVPDLLRMCAEAEGEFSGKLSKREEAEKKHYRAIFDRYYPELDHVIVTRSLPDWCTNLKEVVSIS